MKKIPSVAACFALLAALAAPLRAQEPSAALGNGCMMQQLGLLCPDAAPGSPEFATCSKTRSGEAMLACQKQQSDAAAAKRRNGAPAKNPCADDAQKYCPGKWPGTPEFVSCMKSHVADLTPACVAWGRKRPAAPHTAAGDACVADAKKLCPGLTIADGSKLTDCMTSHYDALSKTCQGKFKGLHKAAQ